MAVHDRAADALVLGQAVHLGARVADRLGGDGVASLLASSTTMTWSTSSGAVAITVPTRSSSLWAGTTTAMHMSLYKPVSSCPYEDRERIGRLGPNCRVQRSELIAAAVYPCERGRAAASLAP